MLGKVLLGLGVPLVAKLAAHIVGKPRLEPYGMRGAGGERVQTICSPGAGGRTNRLCMTSGKPLSATLSKAADVCQFMARAAHADRESFYVLMLDARNQVIGVEEVARGTLTGVEVHPRETFKGAILANAAAIIVAHNHPSGSSGPSNDDRALTQRLAQAGQLLGIPVRDHVIVARDGCKSLRDTEPRLAPWGNPDTLTESLRRRKQRLQHAEPDVE